MDPLYYIVLVIKILIFGSRFDRLAGFGLRLAEQPDAMLDLAMVFQGSLGPIFLAAVAYHALYYIFRYYENSGDLFRLPPDFLFLTRVLGLS